jgi:excisionase family DNA binding protein
MESELMLNTSPLVPHASRPVITPAAACDLLSIRKTKFYELLADGELTSVKRGSRRYVFTDSVLALVSTWRDQNAEAGHAN